MKRISNKILMAVLAVSLGVSAVYSYSNGSYKLLNFANREHAENKLINLETVKESKIPVSSIKKIIANVSLGDIIITPTDKKDIVVKIDKSKGLDISKYNILINPNNEVLSIEVLKKQQIQIGGNINSNVVVNLFIPKEYVNDMELQTDLGNIDVKDIKINKFKCKTNLGDIKGENIQTQNTDVKNSKGDIKLNGFTGNLISKSSLGDTEISYANFNNNIKINSSLGEIKLNLPKESKFNIDAKTDLGDLDLKFPITIDGTSNTENSVKGNVNNGKNTVELKNSNGDISVLKNN